MLQYLFTKYQIYFIQIKKYNLIYVISLRYSLYQSG